MVRNRLEGGNNEREIGILSLPERGRNANAHGIQILNGCQRLACSDSVFGYERKEDFARYIKDIRYSRIDRFNLLPVDVNAGNRKPRPGHLHR